MKRSYAYHLRAMMEKSSESLTDTDALTAPELYAWWEPDTFYPKDTRLRYGEKLWKVLQDHTSSAVYPPSTATASLYAEVVDQGGDTPETAIPYDGNMELFAGKYYKQSGVVYRCFRDTGVPVYNPLAELVGLYVEVVEALNE